MSEDYTVTKNLKPAKDGEGYYFNIGSRRIKADKDDVMIAAVTVKGEKK